MSEKNEPSMLEEIKEIGEEISEIIPEIMNMVLSIIRMLFIVLVFSGVSSFIVIVVSYIYHDLL